MPTDLWNSVALKFFNTAVCNPETEPKVAEIFKTISSNSIQFCLNKNYKIQIHQNSNKQQKINDEVQK